MEHPPHKKNVKRSCSKCHCESTRVTMCLKWRDGMEMDTYECTRCGHKQVWKRPVGPNLEEKSKQQ